ncbi:hypothetical protein FWD07_00720 [Candidatus Saccharibacteria bacterium]|nr:hypothetical protein [Candidatus Saccharibacteria bacterium]
MSKNATPKKPKNQPINTQLAGLQLVIDWFHSDSFNIDEAAGKYQEAITLAIQIEHDLTELKNQINLIDQDFTS